MLRVKRGVFILPILAVFLTFGTTPLAFAAEDSDEMDLKVKVGASISIHLTKELMVLNVSPNPEGVFVHDYTTAVVATNGATGYSLYIHAEEDNALFQEEHQERMIPSLSVSALVTGDAHDKHVDFTMNSWGYAVGKEFGESGLTFKGVPDTHGTDKIRETTEAGDSETDITFAVHANNEVYAGTYLGVISFTAVTNFVEGDT